MATQWIIEKVTIRIMAFGAPIRDYSSKVIAGLSITGLAATFISTSEKSLNCLLEGANEISKNLGYIANSKSLLIKHITGSVCETLQKYLGQETEFAYNRTTC